MKIVVNKPTDEQKAKIESEKAAISRGRSIIERLRSGKGAIVKREVAGETVYIKRLAWPEITRVKLALPRDAAGVLNLQNEDHLLGVTAAMIATCVVVGFPEGAETQNEDGTDKTPTDDTQVFSNVEAVELVNEADALLYVSGLFNAVTEVNPHVLPNSQAAPLKA